MPGIDPKDRAICAEICRSPSGVLARDVANALSLSRSEVNQRLYQSPLLQELCWQDREYRWHGLVQQQRPHSGLTEFSGFYSLVRNFLALSEEAWLQQLTQGCTNIGRSLTDTRGLIHSFRDCREQMLQLFQDLQGMLGPRCLDWEIVFELRLKRARHVRIYADVLVMLPVCSGDMLFNAFDEYLGFLRQ